MHNPLKILTIITLLALSSCQSKPYLSTEEFHTIDYGITTEELIGCYGNPRMKKCVGSDEEEWIYVSRRHIGWKQTETSHLKFTIRNNRVIDKEICILENPVEVLMDRGDFTPD